MRMNTDMAVKDPTQAIGDWIDNAYLLKVLIVAR